MARVAVVIPVYNRSAIVKRAIASVLRQEFTDFELIVVDDGSSDDTASTVAAIEDDRLKLLHQPIRSGANAARNRGIIEATAPILTFLDSDDEYLPEKLGVVVDRFERSPDLGALVDSYLAIVPGENNGLPQDKINPVIETSEEFLDALFGSSIHCRRLRKSTSGISIRRDVAIRAGLFDEVIERRQDLEFLARVAKVARCATCDRPLWIKHETPDSISAGNKGFVAATIVVCRRNPEYLTDHVLSGGLARDVVRYLYELALAGQWQELRRDIRLLAQELGSARLLRLLIRRLLPDRRRRRLTLRA
jgi:glycosyltransferase involved in cell wall biosynthesis